mmetsp:Transcript_10296/g.21632  ORF Transcript_10296/g.21632 Transcript_10296/m.21632 type:complete len:198 (-) Transcript_10296:153-746(-)
MDEVRCKVCGSRFRPGPTQTAHVPCGQDAQGLACCFCEQLSFTLLNSIQQKEKELYDHMHAVHEKCGECFLFVKGPDELVKHRWEEHGVSCYHCTLCDEFFQDKLEKSMHKHACHAFTCYACGAVRTSESEIMSHYAVSHPAVHPRTRMRAERERGDEDGEEWKAKHRFDGRMYHCERCGYEFLSQGDLEDHECRRP